MESRFILYNSTYFKLRSIRAIKRTFQVSLMKTDHFLSHWVPGGWGHIPLDIFWDLIFFIFTTKTHLILKTWPCCSLHLVLIFACYFWHWAFLWFLKHCIFKTWYPKNKFKKDWYSTQLLVALIFLCQLLIADQTSLFTACMPCMADYNEIQWKSFKGKSSHSNKIIMQFSFPQTTMCL